MKKLKILNLSFILGLLFFTFSFLFLAKASAQSVSLGVYPPILQVNTTPPAEASSPISIYNLTDNSVNVKIILKPFTASGSENGNPAYLDQSPTQSFIANNVKILDGKNIIDSITLSAKETKKIALSINIPKDQSRSDYYFSVIFISSEQSQIESNSSQSLGGVATNVLLSVGPQGPTNGEIKEFSAPFFIESGPVPFNLRILNSSDHYITPKGQILITNMFGQTIGKVELLPVNILSNTTRAIPDYPSYVLASKDNNLKFDFKTAFWNEKVLFGLYKADLTISLSNSGPNFKRTIHFFAFPFYGVLTIILIIIIILIVRKRIKNRLVQG